MAFLSWYDWIAPTNPYAASFFGVLLTLIVACIVWSDTKKVKTTLMTFLSGLGVTLIGVLFLNLIGFYR